MKQLYPKPIFLLLLLTLSLFAPLIMRGDASALDTNVIKSAAEPSAQPFLKPFHIPHNIIATARAMPVETRLQAEPVHLERTTNLPAQPTLPMDRMIVVQPMNNRSVTDAVGWNFFGSGVAGVPMHVNGRLITNRTAEGFFSIFMPLERGQNHFTFTQEGQEPITRIITNNAPATPAPTPTIGARHMRDPFPRSDEWVQSGEALALRVIAPAGAVVYAQIGGVTVPMAQTNPDLINTETAIFSAEFTGTHTLPNTAPNDVTDIGRPIYTMTFRDYTTSITAAGHIHQIGTHAPFSARITAPAVWAYPGPTAIGGTHWKLLEGQRDRISAITGDWVRLASGQYVSLDDVEIYMDDAFKDGEALSQGRYIQGEREDVILWDAPIFPAMWAEFDGSRLIIGVGMQSHAPAITYHPDYSIFQSISTGTHNHAPAYFMTLKEDARLDGFYFEHEDNQLRLVLRKRPALSPGDYPLYGLTFVIDPGHGGTDPGALGPMGAEMAEAHLNWINSVNLSELLEELGAHVIFTRSAEAGLTRSERVAVSRNAMPDMFISIHANSTAETTNAGNIHGFSMWYRNANSRPLAQHFFGALYDINPLTNRAMSINQANFYVVRPSWAPSVLFEISFMNNIQDFAWMINPQNQAALAQGIADAILDYFR
ncbi:MAG: N-acetylmuramoyl-L-alanine amidase [Clostridiales bacterium]|jgi:N-acetylmuramoyl-L-alanine amidase|nr:N-acetylmuramoyl-L-alanine amidase [Clostridiales bacterium]